MHKSEIVGIITPILKSRSKLFSKTITSEELEDIESELWVHVFENMPKFESLTSKEIRALASVILKNKAISLYRKHSTSVKRRASFASGSGDELFFDDILSLEVSFLGLKIFDKCRHHLDQHSYFEYKELVSLIEKWSLTQDSLSQTLIKELLNPSDEVLDSWYSLVDSFAVYRNLEYIPSCSFQRLLGISKPKILKIMKNLRNYLNSVYGDLGYSFNYI